MQNTEFDAKVTKISGKWLTWKILCIPVMSLEFNKVTFQVNNKEFNGLIMGEQTCHLGWLRCKSQCSINIDGENHYVIWDPSPFTDFEMDKSETESEESDSDSSDEDRSDEDQPQNYCVSCVAI